MLESIGIKKVRISAYYLESNATIKVRFRTIIDALSKLIDRGFRN